MPRHTPLYLLLAFALTAAGCGASGGAADTDAGTPHPGGTLKFAVSSDAGCVDPQQIGSNDSIYSARQLVDSLTDQDQKTGKIVPWLAKSWEVGDGGRAFTFHLRDGVTFSDGTPVDGEAVKANLDAAVELGARATLATSYLEGYEGTTAKGRTATVRFARPNAQFLQASSTFSLGLLSPATVRKSADERCSGVVGSGPFVLEKYRQNQSITLKKRSDYDWGSSLWKRKGAAYLDRLEFTIVPEAGVRTGSLQSGQVDAIGGVAKQDEQAIRGNARLQARPNPGAVFNLGLNNSRPALRDRRVRQAISLAVNRDELVKTTYTSQTKPATSILASTTPGYVDLGDELDFDAAAAKRLLDDAGWRASGEGTRKRHGKSLRLEIVWSPNAATNKPALQLVQQQLEDVGFDVELREEPISSVTQTQASGNFDALWVNLTRADPDILRTLYSTELANRYRIRPSALDATLDAQATQTDETKRAKLTEQAQRQLVDAYYAVPVVELTTVLGVAKNVHDLDFEASSRIQLHDTWKS